VKATVAIVLSNFNHGLYLRQSLGGICGQTRAADEIIVIDDGSTDDSVDIVREFADRHSTLQLLQNPHNIGLQASIARVLPLVTADYLVWTASDDRLLPAFLEKSMEVLERHPHAGLCFSELSVLRGNSGRVQRLADVAAIAHIFDLADLPEYLAPPELERRMRRAYLPMTSNSVVVRRSALLASGGYPKQLEWYADSFAYMVVALRYGACVVPETLALIRATPGSYSETGRRDRSREADVLTAILDRLAAPDFQDVRRAFRRCPSNFSPWGVLMLRLQLRRPRDWDLFASYLTWKMRQYRRGWGLSWPRAMARLLKRGLAAVPVLRHLIPVIEFGQRGVRALWRWIRRTRLYRVGFILACAVAEYRARNDVTHGRFGTRIEGRVSQETLRDFVVWQGQLLGLTHDDDAVRRIGCHVFVPPVDEEVRLDPVFSLLCASRTFLDFSVIWETSPEALERIGVAPPVAQLPSTFATLAEARRVMTQYVKISHPRAFVVALSLPEDEDSFCDGALAQWLPDLAAFRLQRPGIAFCLLNRTTLGQRPGEAFLAEVAPIRGLGFGVQEGVALARIADAFVGVLDVFGLAALGARRPGIYLDPSGIGRAEASQQIWAVQQHMSPKECLTRLEAIIHSHPAGRRIC